MLRGAVDVSGAYMAYGQSLDLERSRLLFTGPLDDPGLDIRAARKIRTLDVVSGEVTAGVQLTGTLKQPEAKVFSEPAMSEGDALSYLLIGRPLSSAGESDQEALQTAAIAMGLQQALPAVQRIGTSIGLDELSIDTSDLDAGALMAGKYLGPNVYVRYSYSLFNRIGGLLLRFRFNDRFSIETRSGDQDSIDLLYTVEKN